MNPQKTNVKKRILLVDDEPFILRALTFSLKRTGYDVLTSGNGTEALALLRAQADGGAVIDLVVTDIQLPGMTGTELIDAMRAEGIGTPVIAISAYRHSDILKELGSRDIAGFLTKPFGFEQLMSYITKTI